MTEPLDGLGSPVMTLFCGLPGSGNTTLAKRLQAGGAGIRLCTDECQAALGVGDSDVGVHERLQLAVYRHALDLLRSGVCVVLEDGLWTAAERGQKFADARACGARIVLHVFDVPFDTLWARLQRGNLDGSAADYSMTDTELRWAWDLFEPPSPDEHAAVDHVEVHSGGARG